MQCFVCRKEHQKRGEFCCNEHYKLFQRAKRENALHTKFAVVKPEIRSLMRDWWAGRSSKKYAFAAAEQLGVPRRFYEQVA